MFLVFGALKFVPGMSPLEALVQSTWERLTFGLVGGQTALIATAVIEVLAGVLLIAGGAFARVGLVVLALAFVGILSPIVLLPGEVFAAAGPTLTGSVHLQERRAHRGRAGRGIPCPQGTGREALTSTAEVWPVPMGPA